MNHSPCCVSMPAYPPVAGWRISILYRLIAEFPPIERFADGVSIPTIRQCHRFNIDTAALVIHPCIVYILIPLSLVGVKCHCCYSIGWFAFCFVPWRSIVLLVGSSRIGVIRPMHRQLKITVPKWMFLFSIFYFVGTFCALVGCPVVAHYFSMIVSMNQHQKRTIPEATLP